jgi:hypothetical protein
MNMFHGLVMNESISETIFGTGSIRSVMELVEDFLTWLFLGLLDCFF